LIEQKNQKLGFLWRSWASGGMGTKWEFWGFGWPAVGGYGGELPAVVFWWWGRWLQVVGVGDFWIKGGEDGGGVGFWLYGWWERNGENEKRN
jgi:hypothetical protein